MLVELEWGEGRLGEDRAGVAPGDPQPVHALIEQTSTGRPPDNSAGSLPSGTLWPKSSQGEAGPSPQPGPAETPWLPSDPSLQGAH